MSLLSWERATDHMKALTVENRYITQEVNALRGKVEICICTGEPSEMNIVNVGYALHKALEEMK